MADVGLAETEDLRRTGLLEGMDNVARFFQLILFAAGRLAGP